MQDDQRWVARVAITTTDLHDATECGFRRMRLSKQSDRNPYRSKQDRNIAERLGDEIIGCIGEIAVCKQKGKTWEKSVNTLHAPDVPDVGDVRATWRSDGKLIIRNDDVLDRWFTLVTVAVREWPVNATIVGAIYGADVTDHPEWIQNPGGARPSHFVPQDALRPKRSAAA